MKYIYIRTGAPINIVLPASCGVDLTASEKFMSTLAPRETV